MPWFRLEPTLQKWQARVLTTTLYRSFQVVCDGMDCVAKKKFMLSLSKTLADFLDSLLVLSVHTFTSNLPFPVVVSHLIGIIQ